jgi:amidophosphoribosyltransferase
MGVATEQSASRLCSACFDGNYPIELRRQTALGKHVIQRTLANAARTGANPASVIQSENDNVPALRRP